MLASCLRAEATNGWRRFSTLTCTREEASFFCSSRPCYHSLLLLLLCCYVLRCYYVFATLVLACSLSSFLPLPSACLPGLPEGRVDPTHVTFLYGATQHATGSCAQCVTSQTVKTPANCCKRASVPAHHSSMLHLSTALWWVYTQHHNKPGRLNVFAHHVPTKVRSNGERAARTKTGAAHAYIMKALHMPAENITDTHRPVHPWVDMCLGCGGVCVGGTGGCWFCYPYGYNAFVYLTLKAQTCIAARRYSRTADGC